MNYSIKRIIDCWDPVGLLIHAPNNEYHLEIAEIEKVLSFCKDIDILADSIYQIFLESFGKENFCKSRAECVLIAEKIISLAE